MNNKKSIGITFISLLLLLGAASCRNPFEVPDSGSEKQGTAASLYVSVLPGGGSGTERTVQRTVIPDFSALADSWTLELLDGETVGYSENFEPGGPDILLDTIDPGEWTIRVSGYNTENEMVLQGTSAVTLSAGSNAASITVHPLSTTGSGAFSLELRYPAALDLSSLQYRVYPYGEAASGSFTSVVFNGSPVLIERQNLEAGNHILELNFLREKSASNVVVSRLTEAVNIWPDMVSDKWIGPGGELMDYRELSASFFPGVSPFLSSLDFTNAELTASYQLDSGLESFPELHVRGEWFRFSAGGTETGQQIEYSIDDGSTYTEITSGAVSPKVLCSSSMALWIRVTAQDGVSSFEYHFPVKRLVTIRYHPLNGIDEPYEDSVFASDNYTVLDYDESPPGSSPAMQDGIEQVFLGWNLLYNGGGSYYAPGDIHQFFDDIDIYAQWSVIGGRGPGGGIVFFDKENYDFGWRYLEVFDGTLGTAESGLPFAPEPSPYRFFGATQATLGSGKHNSVMIDSQTESIVAASRCRNLESNGYNDWNLPSLNELKQLLDAHIEGLFTQDGLYYSSTEFTPDQVYMAIIEDGTGTPSEQPLVGNNNGFFHPVRSFANAERTRVVAYHPNGASSGTAPFDPMHYPEGVKADIMGNTGNLTAATGDFYCWNTRPDGTGVSYLEGDGVPLNDDLLLFAQYD